MEGDKIEMTTEELQLWIRTKVKEEKLISDVQEKCNLLQSLLERRERQAVQLQKLSQSVAACEAIVKKQYSLLGWEYSDTDSDDDDNKSIADGGNASPSQREFKAEPDVSSSPTTNGHTPLLPKQEGSDSENFYRYNGKNIFVDIKRQPVVVLIRAPPSSLCPPMPQTCDSDVESFNGSDSDTQLEPDEDSNDSDYSVSSFDGGSNKRRKIDEKLAQSHVTPQTSANSGAKCNSLKTSVPQANDKSNAVKTSTPQASDKSNAVKTSTPQANVKSNAVKTSTPQANVKSNAVKTSTPQASVKSNAVKTSTPQASVKSNAVKTSTPQASVKSNAVKTSTPQANNKSSAVKTSTTQGNGKSTTVKASPQASVKSNATKTSTPQTSTNTIANSNTQKTSTPPANTKGETPVGTASTLCNSSNEVSKTQAACSGPQGDISVNMNVLARKKVMSWKQGKITEIITREDGKLKYKISFEKGKSLVSGHHIAFDCMPKVDQLFVGARVVVKSKDEKPRFCPGIVAELPGRKNRMRFLVFLDDLTPVYVSLPFLYLVCRPLADPLDDIGDDSHKNFLKEYIKSWPYPPQIQYRVGQIINAELNGVQQTCEVLEVDCSLIQVLFRTDQCKEWLYRGSLRLEHVVIMREHFKLKQEEEQKKKSHSVNASLKSEH